MIEKRLGIIGVSLLLVYLFVAQATDVATTQVINHFENQQDQIAFAYPDGWEVVQDTGFAGENEIMLYSSDLGSIVISVSEENVSPGDWFAARRSEFHAELIAVVAEFELAGFPVLVIGQPDTCETVAMLQAIISRENDLLHIAYYATWEEADIEAFQTILNSLSFAAETSSHSTVNEIPFITFPSVPETFVCNTQSIQNTTSNNIEVPDLAEKVRQDGLAEKVRQEGEINVIVGLTLPQPFVAEGELSSTHKESQREQIQQAGKGLLDDLEGYNAEVYHIYETIPAVALRLDEAAFHIVLQSQWVNHLQEDIAVPHTLANSTPVIGAPAVWAQGYDGSGQTVVILDTGISGVHSFFRDANSNSRIVAEACFSNATGTKVSLCPNGLRTQTGAGASEANIPACNNGALCNHGVHVAGIAAGNGATFNGVAPNANIISIQVFTRINSASECHPDPAPCVRSYHSDHLAALNYVYNTLHGTHTIASVNMSLGGGPANTSYCDTNIIKPAIDNLRSVGIATIISAGNDGWTNGISSPACISTAVAVGSTTNADAVSGFSNVHNIMDLFAPGSNIYSAVVGDFDWASGTSMAAPHVAGAWAVLKQADPTASVNDILGALAATGIAITDGRPGGTYTKPRIQLNAALATVLANASTVKARKCTDAPMYIPMEGALTLPWGCIDEPVCAPYHRNAGPIYFRQPHRGIDIASGKPPGRTPVYAPYNATVVQRPNNHTLRLRYDAPYGNIASYLTHMGNSITGQGYVEASIGAKVYGGITRLGYEGDAGSPGGPHLHISWHGWPGGESDFSNTLDPTPYLLAQNLRFHANWARIAGPLTCTTNPVPPPAPPTTDFFNEELATSQLNADTIWWFPWYDSSLGRRDTIHVANPGPNSARIDIYVAGQRRTTAASVAAGGAWHIRYDGLIGGPVKIVSTNGQPIVASKRTIWNEPQVSTLDFPTNVPTVEPFGIGDASTVWWSPWYDSTNDRRNWILVGNPGPNYAQVEIRIGGEKTPDSPYVIPAGKVWTPRYMDRIGGPVQVISLNQQPVFVSQRVLWPDTRSFNEVQGMPQHLADTEWWAPWYDASNGINNSIHVVNTANSAATIDVYVAGVKRTNGATIPAGGRWHARYDDVIGGPVRVISTNGRQIIVSQRVLWTNHASFDETMAVPAGQLDTTWWFPWYDSTGTRIAVIHLANPGPGSARVEIYIDGQRTADTPVTIPAGAAWHTRYLGTIGGPVRIVSTNGQTILANQRVRWDGAGVFNEVKGVPQALLALPQGPAPLHINTLAVTTPDGNIISEVRQSQYVHFGLGAENWTGTWEDTYWDWTVRDSQGSIVSAMSRPDVPLYIPTGLIGHRVGVQVPANLPPGEYVLTGSVVDANNSASATSSVSFRVNESMNLYLPLITR